MEKQLGQDILKMYEPYKNTKTVWKKSTVNNQIFQLPDHYEILKFIGAGGYGAVVAAIDHSCNDQQQKMVAIKKMTNVFDHKIITRRILRELRLLRLLKHENIVELKTIILPRSRSQFHDIYAIFQLINTDLSTTIRCEELSGDYSQFYIYQILKSLKYIHSATVVHRDLKPRNILIDSKCDVKICDFGLARIIFNKNKEIGMTDYVATRWYRAPQLLLGQTQYCPAVDVWSVGCIIAEIFTKKPFLPSTNTRAQLQLIIETIQMPAIQGLKHTSEDQKRLLMKMMKKKKKLSKIDEKMKGAPPQAIDLMKKMLTFQPQKRITVKQALKHPYMADLHLEEDEPERQPINILQFEFENFSLTTQQLKDTIYEQILLHHFKDFSSAYEKKRKNNKSLISHIVQNSNSKNIDPITDADQDEEQEEDD